MIGTHAPLTARCSPSRRGGVGEQRGDQTRPACAGRPPRSGSTPCSRSSALVAGPIETSRGPLSEPPAAAKKRTDDADVKST